ncbi:MAG: divergent polysaccharide deacetylase family protein [bacterium]|nr:MAG: divergent polysaccharide deacetylase family protein [bacterium]
MVRKRSYKRKLSKSTKKRRTTRAAVKRRRKQTESKVLDIVAKIIRLAVLIGICAFIIYQLFRPDEKSDQPTKQEKVETSTIEDNIIEQPIEQEVKLDTLPKDQALDYLLHEVFDSFNLEDSWIKRNGDILRVQLPAELPAVTIIWEIIQQIKQLDLKVIESEEDLRANKSTISIGPNENKLLTIIFNKNKVLKRKTGKIAIIIDDFGYYNNRTTEKFLEFKYPITFSIIPGQKHSIKIAQQAKKHDKSIMIHLPMEALEETVEDGEFTIMTDMPDSVIADRVQKALAYLPDAVGINNHMGSKATADTHVMEIVFNELKTKGRFFVDSKTTDKSVISDIASKYDVKYAINDGFLEQNKNEDEVYIQRKLAAIAKIARKRGKAVVIGHPYKETIKVLSEEIPKLERQGFKIVPITNVVR